MKRSLKVTLALTTLAALMGVWSRWSPESRVLGRNQHAEGSLSTDLLSAPYHLDRVYMSMTGPWSNQRGIRLSETAPPEETLWLTGIETQVVAADGLTRISNEYFCHSNLTLDPGSATPEQLNASFDSLTHGNGRFFTLIPGRISLMLPPGFGLPVKNAMLLDSLTMALNQNPGIRISGSA